MVSFFCKANAQEDSLAKSIFMKYWDVSKYYPDYFGMIGKGDGFIMVLQECTEVNKCTSLCFGIMQTMIIQRHDLYDDRHPAWKEKYVLEEDTYIVTSKVYGTFHFKVIGIKDGVLTMKVWK